MAQGNYVTLPGGSGPNPFKGVSDSLADLSKMYSDKATVDREEALQREKIAEDQRRWNIQNDRLQLATDRETEAYNNAQAMTDWYKNFGTMYNPDDIRAQKAKNLFGVTDKDLSGKLGRQILDAVPVYQEDVARFYGKDFVSQFGKEFDPTAVQSVYSGLDNLQELQTREDAAAKNRFETAKFFTDRDIKIAQALGPKGTAGTVRSGGSKSTKIPKTYADINVFELVKDFESNGDWHWIDSDRQDAANVVKDTLTLLEKEGEYNAAQAQAIAEFVLDRSREGGDLKSINTNKTNMNKLITQAKQGMTDSYNARTGDRVIGAREGNEAAIKFLEGELRHNLDVNAYAPRNIRDLRRTAAQQTIDRLLGRIPAAPKKTTVPRPAKSGQNRNWDLTTGAVFPSQTTALNEAEKALLAAQPQQPQAAVLPPIPTENRYVHPRAARRNNIPVPPKTKIPELKQAQQEVTRLEREFQTLSGKPQTMWENVNRAMLYNQLQRAKGRVRRLEREK